MTSNLKSEQFSTALPNIDEVEPFNEGDHFLMAEIKALLIKHKAQDRFGVMLLHDHFPLAEDEVMIETEDTKHRTLISKPMKVSALHDYSIVDTQWRLDSADVLVETVMGCVKYGTGHTVQV